MATEDRPTLDSYPVHCEAASVPEGSRGLWLIKWLLLVPHIVVLMVLWLGGMIVFVIAVVAILLTGRYPRPLFDYTSGLLRWTWRVQYYGYGVLGTDRYPPFTLADVPDYPARLRVDYPERLSRGLVLVKWWLLAIPQYLVVGILVGTSSGRREEDSGVEWSTPGLIGILVLIAAIVLLFTGNYPRPLYRFIVGLNRWVYRVYGYAALLTDAYPPFRLDMDPERPSRAVGRSSPQDVLPSASG